MSTHRFFITETIVTGEDLILPQDTSHHIQHVLRLRENTTITLFNGRGGEYLARISSFSKKTVTASIISFSEINRQPALEVHLGLCVLKRDAMDRVIARATELGASSMTPIISEHCSVSPRIIRKRESHWQQVVEAACEQCGLNMVPQIISSRSLPDWLASCKQETRIVALQASGSIASVNHRAGPVALLSGPEGGFSDEELALIGTSQFASVTLGNRILRAETAPLVALSVLHHRWGDFQ